MEKLDYLHEIFSSPEKICSDEFRQWLEDDVNRKLFEQVFAQREAVLRSENIRVDVEEQMAKVLAAAGAVSAVRHRKVRLTRRLLIPAAAVAGVAVMLLFVGRSPIGDTEVPGSPATIITSDGRVVAIEDNTNILVDGATASNESIRYEATAQDETVNIHTLSISTGHTYKAELSDGTVVWLNADSHLRYPTRFSGDTRRVFLEGEAFFEVAHDPDKPFIVDAGGQELTVLGTEFNLYAYPGGESTVTTLLSGSISVKASAGGGVLILSPGEQAELTPGSDEYTIRNVHGGDIAAWKEGVFVVEDNTLEQVMNKLSRWYGVDVSFADSDAKGIMFQGSIPQFESVSSVLNRIEEISPVKFEVRNNTVKVKMRK